MDFNWKSVVSTVAPALGTALGSPLAGLAVKAICDSFGTTSGTDEDLAKAIAGATPEDLLKLKQAGQAFAIQMKTLEVDLEKLQLADVDSARKREMAVLDHTNRNMAYAYTLGFFGLLSMVMVNGVKPEIETMMNVLIGILAAAQASIMGYYFGSSKGSDDKNKLLAGK